MIGSFRGKMQSYANVSGTCSLKTSQILISISVFMRFAKKGLLKSVELRKRQGPREEVQDDVYLKINYEKCS